MGQQASSKISSQKGSQQKQESVENCEKSTCNTDTAEGTQTIVDSYVKQSQSKIIEQLSNSRVQLKVQREQEIKRVTESKDKDMLAKILKIMEQNQEQLVEILDERVQLINQNLEDKLLVLENKIDEINDKLIEFENVMHEEVKGHNAKEGIESLRKEVKQMVAISEKYIKDENKLQEIQNLSVLHKTIHKENKHSSSKSRDANGQQSKLSQMRDKSKLQKQMSDSQILKDVHHTHDYSDDNTYQYQHNYSIQNAANSNMNFSSFFNQNQSLIDYNQNQYLSKIE